MFDINDKKYKRLLQVFSTPWTVIIIDQIIQSTFSRNFHERLQM